MSGIPFDTWLRLAVRMGISPRDFWHLSLKEWRMLITPSGPAPLGRGELEALRARFPDAPHPNPPPVGEGGHAPSYATSLPTYSGEGARLPDSLPLKGRAGVG